MFWCQVVATIIAGTVQIGVQTWMFDTIENICDPRQPQYFSCPNTEVFYTASIVWGVVGPGLQFSKGKVYSYLLFAFLAGAIVPFIPWALTNAIVIHKSIELARFGREPSVLVLTVSPSFAFTVG